MLNKKSLAFLLLLIIGGSVFYAVKSGHHRDPGTRYEKVMHRVGEMLETWHYSPRKIDDNFSKEVFHNYIKFLDPDRHYFLASDIAQLKKYETKIDDELLGAKLESFYAINVIYVKRLNEASGIYRQILASPFKFNVKEYYINNPDSLKFGKNDAERRENWRKKIKYSVLDRYVDILEQREKKTDTSLLKKTDVQLEAEAREKVLKSLDRINERFAKRNRDDDRFNAMINLIAQTMDPHTNYYAPIEKRTFDEGMSGEFYGIGATLMEEDGNVKITTVVTGSPAYKSGMIQPGDFIIKVAQGQTDFQDLTGYSVDEAVKLIRGKKGTEVRLTVKKPDGSTKIVTMVREKINIDEIFARSAIINGADKHKIGYIYLSEFYANFNDPNGARCANDVAKEIQKLKDQNVEGIILDLRSNGGGSLMDVVKMVGFFIEDGPVVQVKSKGEEDPSLLNDRDNNTVLWTGPLTVMVNEFSASASEIFAAAIQDYGRGIVIGSTSTYGKGTVQRTMELDENTWLTGEEGVLGSIKLTIQKFYRINGGSTQLRGVYSDIVLPDQYAYLEYSEKYEDKALPWDEIRSAKYKKWQGKYDINEIINKSRTRVSQNSSFNDISVQTKILLEGSKKKYCLEINQFRKERNELTAAVRRIDTLTKLSTPLDITNIPLDLKEISRDSLKIERNNSFLKIRKNDLYLSETIRVVDDMINEEKYAKSKQP
jgi:carboxyl-terminal processing protease